VVGMGKHVVHFRKFRLRQLMLAHDLYLSRTTKDYFCYTV
jgi:hypothetical protein